MMSVTLPHPAPPLVADGHPVDAPSPAPAPVAMWAEREVVLPPDRRRTFPASDLRRLCRGAPPGQVAASPSPLIAAPAPPPPEAPAPAAPIRSTSDLQVDGGLGALRARKQISLLTDNLRGAGTGGADVLYMRELTPTMLKMSALDLMSKEFSATSAVSVVEETVLPWGGGNHSSAVNPTRDRTTTTVRPAAASDRHSIQRNNKCTISGEEALLLAPAHADSFRLAIRLSAVIGQCYSLIPTSTRPDIVPSFSFFSIRVLYWACVTAGLFANAVLAVVYVVNREAEVNSITASSMWMFYVSATTVSVLYFRLAMQWRRLCLCFLRVEHRMRDCGYPPRLRFCLRGTTVAVLSLALVEYALAVSTGIISMKLDKYNTFHDFFADYFSGNYPHLLMVMSYSPVLLILIQTLNTTATFMWNYNDLFIMLISVAIAQRFKLLNRKLNECPKSEKTREFWKDAREKYNALAILTREVDKLLCVQILFSFMNNLYFICIQLLRTVKHDQNSVLHNVYYLYSFGFLILRTALVSLFAASINDESKNVKKVLYSVSSTAYCEEVDRFIIQATTDEIALTGLKFFNVTRSFLLTVAGTIATYEIVLVQFNGNKKTS